MLRLLPAAIITIICVYSCSSNTDEGNITLLKEINNSLLRSNEATTLSTDNITESLEYKIKDPATYERAARWFEKATVIKTLTDSIVRHITQIKTDLIEEAGFDPLKEEKPKSARQAVQHIFNEHKEGQLLHEKLALYKKDLLAVDSILRQHMTNSISIAGTDMITREESFADRYFNTTILGAITMLNKIENDIRVTENKLIEFCNDNVTGCNLGLVFDSYHPIISQNATIVRPGENMEIKAGVGAYTVLSKPVIVIAGKEIPLNERGYSLYDFKASDQPGTYRLPVIVKYFDQTMGKEVVVTEILQYTVKPDQ